jgi:hypothetical protein
MTHTPTIATYPSCDVYVWFTVRETSGPYQVDGVHLDEESARGQAEKLAAGDFPPSAVFYWAPVSGADPEGPAVLFVDTPDEEDIQTRHQVHWRSVRLGRDDD